MRNFSSYQVFYIRKFTIFANYHISFMKSPTNRIKDVLIKKRD